MNKKLRKITILATLILSANIFANDGGRNVPQVPQQPISQATFLDDDGGIVSGRKDAIKGTSTIFQYADNSIYQIFTKPEYLTTLKLQPGEKVNFIAGGDTERWMIEQTEGGKDNRVYIYLKPLEEDLSSNLVITTDRHTYFFNMESTISLYNPLIEWQYPQERAILFAQYEANNEALGIDDITKLNSNYTWLKTKYISPVQIMDNGEKTFITMKDTLQEMPAFYIKGEDNQLSLTNTKIEGRNVIIDQVAKEIYLISGKQSLVIKNKKIKK